MHVLFQRHCQRPDIPSPHSRDDSLEPRGYCTHRPEHLLSRRPQKRSRKVLKAERELQTRDQLEATPAKVDGAPVAKSGDQDVGKVLYIGEGIAIIQGLHNDAPVGTKLGFVSGASGSLLWRRSDNICYALIQGGSPEKGEGVMSKVKGIIQVLDEEEGPSTKRDYEISTVPVGRALVGKSTDFLGRQESGSQQLGGDVELPLFNEQVPMDDRAQINEPLFTGLKAVDVLTPIGRGQALLVVGQQGAGKSSLVLDAILGQRDQDVQCIYASVGQSVEESERQAELLRHHTALDYTSIVAASSSETLGKRFAALCAACSRGEHIRDAGGHALVVLDDIRCLVEMWEHISEALVGIGLSVAPPSKDKTASNDESEGDSELVEYEGMLVSAAAAQRRQFFSSLVQRAAKLHERNGGGSLTLLLVLPGTPATGRKKKKPDLSKYQHLSPEMRAKLGAALAGKADEAGGDSADTVRTEVIEEFMSLADGQAVLKTPQALDPEAGVQISMAEAALRSKAISSGLEIDPPTSNPEPTGSRPARTVELDTAASVSRIGGRALYPALRDLALSARLQMVQALDADEFSASKADPATAAALQQAAQYQAALRQQPAEFVPLEEQVVVMFAAQSNMLKDIDAESVPELLAAYTALLRDQHPDLLRDIAASNLLPSGCHEILEQSLRECVNAFSDFGL